MIITLCLFTYQRQLQHTSDCCHSMYNQVVLILRFDIPTVSSLEARIVRGEDTLYLYSFKSNMKEVLSQGTNRTCATRRMYAARKRLYS